MSASSHPSKLAPFSVLAALLLAANASPPLVPSPSAAAFPDPFSGDPYDPFSGNPPAFPGLPGSPSWCPGSPFWWFGPPTQHHHAIGSAGVAFACYGGGGNCACPRDLWFDRGVLINVWPGYQCAYPGGACTWDDKTGVLQNTEQTNCPVRAACSTASGCSCPTDLNDDAGVLINQFTGYQCAYPHGACTWDSDGDLVNTGQTNCVASAKCQQTGQDS